MNKKDSTFHRNTTRDARQMYDQTRHAGWQPEHERMNVDPVVYPNAAEAFRYRVPHPDLHTDVAPGPSVNTRPAPVSRQIRVIHPSPDISGMNHENAWMDDSQSDHFLFDEVPDPPPTPFTHQPLRNGVRQPDNRVRTQRPPQNYEAGFRPQAAREIPPEFVKPPGNPVNETSDDDYCVFISGKLSFASPSLDDIEDALNKLIFGENPISSEEVVVMKRLSLKIGAFIR